MKHPLFIKACTLAALMLLLLIPIGMIGGIIEDRQALHHEVVDEIANSSTRSQQLVGPLLVIPYSKSIRQWKTNPQDNSRIEEMAEQRGVKVLLPEQLSIDAGMATEIRSRGIYEARLYHADTHIQGHFDLSSALDMGENNNDYKFHTPYVALGIDDVRGIENKLEITINGDRTAMQPSTRLSQFTSGVHAPVSTDVSALPEKINFSLTLMLQGSDTFSIIPTGKATQLSISSDWPHPSFYGNQLPTKRSISDLGFSATWQTSYFASNIVESFERCQAGDCNAFNATAFGVEIIDPVDRYVKSDRAIKYALLFVALTFACFALFEVLKQLKVHPVQYGLVGLSLAIFYLLLVSLSEHMNFGQAYLIASGACVGLIGFYVSHILQSLSRALGFSTGLAALYALLWGLLGAEDYALLMGSLLLFGVLGLIMVLTRKINWYQLNGRP